MEVREELLNIAEISIGIAGFSGVIAAFLQSGGLHPLDRIRFVMLFAMSFATLVLAYVPIVVSQFLDEAPQIWAWSSGVMIAVWIASVGSAFYFLIPELKKSTDQGNLPGALLWGPSFLNLAVQALNAGGWLWAPGFVAYLFGLFVYLYASGLMFVLVIMFRPTDLAADRVDDADGA